MLREYKSLNTKICNSNEKKIDKKRSLQAWLNANNS